MTFAPRPSHSKSSVDRAGRALTVLIPKTAEYQAALTIVNEWRTCHAYPLNTFKSTLRRKAGKYRGSLVAQRLKRLPTIIDKLKRFEDMKLSQMQDIGGIRAVLPTLNEVSNLYREYKDQARFTHELIRERDYINDPKADGYRGIHLVFKYNNTLARNGVAQDYHGLAIELQIRTQLQHTWATAVETVGTLRGEAFKTGRGAEEWREFFALVSSAFAITEGANIIERHRSLSPREIYLKIKKIESKLKVLDSIMGLSHAASVIQDGRGLHFNIIVLDKPTKNIKIYGYPRNMLSNATRKYAELESEAGNDKDIVLVSAGDLGSLKAAYPNYFLDVRDFTEKVKVIIEEAK